MGQNRWRASQERRPRIAIILDENTSADASRYEASKGYFTAIRDAGGLPFGIPYLPEIVAGPGLGDVIGALVAEHQARLLAAEAEG